MKTINPDKLRSLARSFPFRPINRESLEMAEDLLLTAADEIEKLREEVKRLKVLEWRPENGPNCP